MLRGRIGAAVCLAAYLGLCPTALAITETGRPFFGATFDHRDSLRLEPEVEPRVTDDFNGRVSMWCSSWGGHWLNIQPTQSSALHVRRIRSGYLLRARFTREVAVGALGPVLKVTTWINGTLVGSPVGPGTIRGTIRTRSTGPCSQPRVAFVARWIVPEQPGEIIPGEQCRREAKPEEACPLASDAAPLTRAPLSGT